MNEYLILVDEQDTPIGQSEKLAAHEQGLRHRAFSIFIYRTNPLEILLQHRHPNKYHCGGLWTNTCCGHPRPNEETLAAGQRRLFEEMGIQTTLTEIGVFEYISHFDNGLTEHEIDHVLIGTLPHPNYTINPEELTEDKWISPSVLASEIYQNPEGFTPWLLPALSIFQHHAVARL